MKYIVIELQKSADGAVANLVTPFDTLDAAYNKYYLVLASAAISTLPTHSAMIVSEEGFTVESKCFKH